MTEPLPTVEDIERKLAEASKYRWLELKLGEAVVARVVEKKTVLIRGVPSLLYVVETRDGDRLGLKPRTTLYPQLEAQKADVGKIVYIRYDGQRISKTRVSKYYAYTVKVLE